MLAGFASVWGLFLAILAPNCGRKYTRATNLNQRSHICHDSLLTTASTKSIVIVCLINEMLSSNPKALILARKTAQREREREKERKKERKKER